MHVRRDSVFQLLDGRDHPPAMADDKQPTRPWKRVVAPLGPDWMIASVGRLEEARAETLDSARKRQRETPREGDEEMAPASASAAAASSASSQPTALPSSMLFGFQIYSQSLPPDRASAFATAICGKRVWCHIYCCCLRLIPSSRRTR